MHFLLFILKLDFRSSSISEVKGHNSVNIFDNLMLKIATDISIQMNMQKWSHSIHSMAITLKSLHKLTLWPMHGSRGWGRGSGPPFLNNHKNIGFHSNTGANSLKITKLPSQHSRSGRHLHANKTSFNGVSLAGRWWPTFSWFYPLSPNQLKKCQSWSQLSGFAHVIPTQILAMHMLSIVKSEYVQDISHSHTADKSKAPWGRVKFFNSFMKK